MSTLWLRRATPTDINNRPPLGAPVSVSEEQRRTFTERIRAIPTTTPRRLDAWGIERGGRPDLPFAWSATTARRIIGTNAARRVQRTNESLLEAVRDEIADQLILAASGRYRSGSLAHWLAGASHPTIGLITAEAVNWTTQLLDALTLFGNDARLCPTDAYYNVSGAATTLRGRRDLQLPTAEGRVIVRMRSGAPGPSAGAGLRTDLFIDTLAHPDGVAAQQFIGLWPDAGLLLLVPGTVDNLRSGARSLLRGAVVQRRLALETAA